MEKESQNIKEPKAYELVGQTDTEKQRTITQSSKIRISTSSVNRIREAKKKAGTLIGKEGNKAVFQYQFEIQNKEEES